MLTINRNINKNSGKDIDYKNDGVLGCPHELSNIIRGYFHGHLHATTRVEVVHLLQTETEGRWTQSA